MRLEGLKNESMDAKRSPIGALFSDFRRFDDFRGALCSLDSVVPARLASTHFLFSQLPLIQGVFAHVFNVVKLVHDFHAQQGLDGVLEGH